MSMIPLLRPLFTLLSLFILAAAAYLLWTWYDGQIVIGPDGAAYLVHEPWRLWTGLGLLVWSFLGRFVVRLVVARPDSGPKSLPDRGAGEMVIADSGAQLYVESHGAPDGPVIILTHGWGLDSTVWNYAVKALSPRFRVIIWDLPGLGRSKLAPNGLLSLTSFAADLASLIRWAGDQPVVLVGHSIGGMTLQTLAQDHAELVARRVSGLVLLNTTYTNPLHTIIFSRLFQALQKPLIEPLCHLAVWLQPLAWLSAWQSYFSGSTHLANRLGCGRYISRSQLDHVSLLTTRNPPGVQAKGNLAMFHWDGAQALSAMTVPAQVVGGDMDIITKLEASRHIAESIPKARLQVVDGMNHLGFLERADIYNAAIADFAKGLKAQDQAAIQRAI